MKKVQPVNIFTIISLGLILISCGSSKNASNNSTPAWADNPGNQYSSQKYLLAVGSGSTLKEAENDAFASLSQIFQQDIEATQEMQDELVETSINNSEVFTEGTTKLLNNVRIGTSQKLMNSTILESQFDNNGTYYALAGMDKRESARIYNQEITNNEFKLRELEENSDEENNILQKLILLKKTRLLAQANENLSRQHNILMDGLSDTEHATKTLSRIEEKFRTVQQRANINLVSDNASSSVLTAVSEVLQRAGFSISDQNDPSILEVTINFQTQKAELNRDDAEFVKWELGIDIKDMQTNRSFKTYFTEGRDGGLSYQEALKRADFTVREKITTQFQNFLNQELLAIN